MKSGMHLDLLFSIAQEIRKDVVRMSSVARAAGVDASLSLVDVIVYLYWGFFNIDPKEPHFSGRDRFILGDMDGCSALYAVLARYGFFDREQLWCYLRLGAVLQGTPDIRTPGIDAPATAHGFAAGIAVGMARELQAKGSMGRVVCLLNREQLFEEIVQNAFRSASMCRLGRMMFIITTNNPDEKEPLEYPSWLTEEMGGLGVKPFFLDGHSFSSLESFFSGVDWEDCRPKMLILHTRLGKGLPFIESNSQQYKRMLTMSESDLALSILEVKAADEE